MLRFWAEKATILVAADRGADHLIASGVFPHVVLGDLDSSSLDWDLGRTPDIHKFEDQDYSDCDKLMDYFEQQGYTDATIIGFEGDRIDHVLASLGSFLRSGVKVRIAIRHGLAHVLKGPGGMDFHSFPGQTVSILPIVPSRGVTSDRLTWPLCDERLSLGARLSLSNLSESERFSVYVEEGALLIVQEFDEARLPEW